MAVTIPPTPDKRTTFYQREADDGSYLSSKYNQAVLRELLSRVHPEAIGRICDVGSGAGSNLPMLNSLFPLTKVVTADISLTALALGRSTASYVMPTQSDIATLPFPSESMDLVVCTEVLEHVADLNGAVAELARIVRKNGYVAISSPNYLNPMGVRKWWKDRQLGNSYWDPWGGHPGFERLMLPATVKAAVAPLLATEATLGAGYLMGWIPLGFRRIGRVNDEYPLRWVGRLPILRNMGMGRFLLLRKKARQ